MEEQVYRKLDERDQELIAGLFETEAFRSIMKAGDIFQQDKSEHIALLAPDMNNVVLNRGNIYGARFIVDLIKLAHQKQKKA